MGGGGAACGETDLRHICLAASCMLPDPGPGTEPANQAYALNQESNEALTSEHTSQSNTFLMYSNFKGIFIFNKKFF